MSDIIEKLALKYNLKADSYFKDLSPYVIREKNVKVIIDNWEGKGYPPEEEFIPKEYRLLKAKWESFVLRSWCGFDLGPLCPVSWYQAIDEFLEHVQDECPTFRIAQIKIKFGALNMYLKNLDEEVKRELYELQDLLSDKALKY